MTIYECKLLDGNRELETRRFKRRREADAYIDEKLSAEEHVWHFIHVTKKNHYGAI